jgi:hypothetical protein
VNLERHLSVLWRYRAITVLGIVLGAVLAFLAAFDVTHGLQRRGTEQWSSVSQIFVTQDGFPWGRVTFPVATDPGSATNSTPTDTSGNVDDSIKFADPTRFPNLAFLYSFLTNSDEVRGKLPGPPSPEQIQAVPLDPTGRGDAFLPIIQLTTSADSAAGAVKLNRQTIDGLKGLLTQKQSEAKIASKDRVVLTTISKPSEAALIAGRSLTPSLLAFMLCVILSIALAHVLEGIRQARSRRQAAVAWQHPVPANGTITLSDFEPVAAEAGAPVEPRRRSAG